MISRTVFLSGFLLLLVACKIPSNQPAPIDRNSRLSNHRIFNEYEFKGKLFDKTDSTTIMFATVEYLKDTVSVTGTHVLYGEYNLTMSAQQKISFNRILVRSVGYLPENLEIDPTFLVDSIIEMNFYLTKGPHQFEVIIKSYPSHRLYPKDSIDRK